MSRPVNIANLLTFIRLGLAPLFVAVYLLTSTDVLSTTTLLALLWSLFLVMELTDVLDGMVARRQNLVTDLGKILDPFADVVCRLTYFVVLSVARIIPLWFVMVVVYRELVAVFLRLLFVRDGYALGAGVLGKLKSWFYAVSAALGLFLFSTEQVGTNSPAIDSALPGVRLAATIVYSVAAVLALWSIAGYIRFYAVRHREKSSE